MIQTAFLGDVLLCGLLCREIKKRRPRSPLYMVTRQGLGSLVKALRFADHVFEIEKGNKASYREAREELKKHTFKWIFCPHPSIRSKLFAMSFKAERRIGFRDWLTVFLFHRTIRSLKIPDALRQWSLIGAVDPQVKKMLPYLNQLQWTKKTSAGLLPSVAKEYSINCRSLILDWPAATTVAPKTWAIFPGSVWATKQWMEESFLKLSEMLCEQDYQVLWMGGKSEAELCGRLAEKNPRTRTLAGQTSLVETLSVLARCEGVIANDSGGQHLAAVAGLPILSIFGPTVLESGFRPWSKLAAVAESENLFCRPCGPHGHQKCPRDTHECMRTLSVQEVFQRWEVLNREARLNFPETLSR